MIRFRRYTIGSVPRLTSREKHKLLKVMKLTTVLLFIACLHAVAHTSGQTVTLSLRNVPVQKVFKAVSRQTGVSIVYCENLFEGLHHVSINVKNAPVKDVLQQCLTGASFEYSVQGNTIVIRKRSVIELPTIANNPPAPPPAPTRRSPETRRPPSTSSLCVRALHPHLRSGPLLRRRIFSYWV